ncbi:hypothetical protein V8F06_014933, partial [Rhypophila decipiens]
GTTVYKTTPHTPWQNGGSEVSGKIVFDRVRAVMIEHNIPDDLWPFVVDSVIKVLNITPSRSNANDDSPIVAMCKDLKLPVNKTYLRHLRSYFCPAYYYVKPAYRVQSDKLADRAKKGYLIAYDDMNGRIYWIWNPEEGAVIRASAVRFNEE